MRKERSNMRKIVLLVLSCLALSLCSCQTGVTINKPIDSLKTQLSGLKTFGNKLAQNTTTPKSDETKELTQEDIKKHLSNLQDSQIRRIVQGFKLMSLDVIQNNEMIYEVSLEEMKSLSTKLQSPNPIVSKIRLRKINDLLIIQRMPN